MPDSGRGLRRGAAAGTAAWPLTGFRPSASIDLQGIRSWLRRCVAHEVEQRRLFPWIAVSFGIGVLLFFAAEGQPARWAPVSGLAIFAALAPLLRQRPFGRGVAVAFAALFAGFLAGVLRQQSVDAPVLQRLVIAPVTGFVETIEERGEGARAVVKVHEVGGLAPEARPTRIRLTLREKQALKSGDFIAATARLLPPPEPARPGGYDFARDAYFRGIGTVGSIAGKVEVRPPPAPPGLRLSLAALVVDDARNALTRRIAQAIGGPAGAVAAALVTGKRGLIDEDTNDALRAAGIYHIVSISGLHMVLAAGTFFWIARALLALSPFVALHWPIKKIAAVIAMAGATAYCIFSGSEVATERSLVMILVMLGAILVDRPALSLRNLAISALIVLALEPEALLGPSFQMSYGAVVALIAAAEWVRRRSPAVEIAGPGSKALAWLVRTTVAVLGSTLIASLATAPFGSYHFHTLNPFGLLGNALALPLVSLVVMPCAVLGVLVFPFGLDRLAWEFMGLAVAGVLWVSEWVGGLSGSTVLVPAFGAGALALLALALLVLTLLASPLRWVAILPAACGVGLAATAERSDVLIDRAGSGAAVRGADGRLAVLGRPSSFVVEQWLRADGDRRSSDDPALRAAARCDALGCNIADAGGRVVALVRDRRALLEDCERATAVLTPLTVPPTCRAHLVIDGRFLATYGATAIRWTSSEAVITTARRPELNRPWMRLPVQTAAGAQAGPMPDPRRIPPRRPAPPSRDPLDPPLDDGQPSAPERPDQ